MDVRAIGTSNAELARYEELFRACFPRASHLRAPYLEWLYCHNPAGPVIGCDAWQGDRLAAHYVCIPVDALVAGARRKVMLSLNTATHPDFQGQGLFTRLAEATYAMGAAQGIWGVYGVANANSTPGFVRKLGFTLVSPLDAMVGVGRLDTGKSAEAEFRRDWTADALRWRIANPVRPYRLVRLGNGRVGAEARTDSLGLRAWDEMPLPSGVAPPIDRPAMRAHVHLGLRSGTSPYRKSWVDIPQRFRPSPLNMIVRILAEGGTPPSSGAIHLGQLDFDAF